MRQYWCDDLLDTEWLDNLERDAVRDGGVTKEVLARLVWSVRELRALLVAERESVRWTDETRLHGLDPDRDAFDIRPDEDVVAAVERQFRLVTEAITAIWNVQPEPQRWVRILSRAPWGMLARMAGPIHKILRDRAMRHVLTQWHAMPASERVVVLKAIAPLDLKTSTALDEEG